MCIGEKKHLLGRQQVVPIKLKSKVLTLEEGLVLISGAEGFNFVAQE